MPAPTKGPRLGGGAAHERLMLANLATALFEHGRIKTTEARARRLRPFAERLVTFAKRGDLPARRKVMTIVRDKSVVHALFAEIGPRFENRPGGYTRITKVGPRKGDNAPMAVIELVEALTVAQTAVGEAERARGTRFAGKSGSAAAAGAATGVAATDEDSAAAGTTDAAAATADADENVSAAPEQAPASGGTDAPAQSEPSTSAAVPADDTNATLDDLLGSREADEAGDQPAEGTTSAQTATASAHEQAEGEPTP